ncbi:unnamed protein product [Meloidogyne enterolobii]|uniref:Uncharacterized protein n=1 Tax=Meloidogyne enterolobii TaxID=390850 RepID=A0ACB0YSC4_MELEN
MNDVRAIGMVTRTVSIANRSDTAQRTAQLVGRQHGMVEQVEWAECAFAVFAMVMLLLHAVGDIKIATTM